MRPEIIEKDGDCRISINYLKRIGVPEDKIKQGMRDYLDGRSQHWKCDPLSVDEEIYFYLDSLPTEIERQVKKAQTLVVSVNNVPEGLLRGLHQLDLKYAYEKGYEDFLGNYSMIKDEKSRKRHAKKHAVLLKAMEIYMELGCKKSAILRIYNTLRAVGINYYTTPQSFRRKFRQVRLADNFAEEVLHKITRLEKHPAKKVDEWIQQKIIDLMGQKWLKVDIHVEINKNRPLRKQISYATLLRYITAGVKNISAEKRYGYAFYKKHLEPYVRKMKPEFKFQVIEADGSRLQLPFRSKFNKLKFLKIYVLIDVHSSLILGFSLGEEETTEVVMLAFNMAFHQHRFIPVCIITDKSSAHTSHAFSKFKEDTNLLYKTLWREHLPDFPNAKGTVENFFRNFHIQVVRKYFGYFGLSISAKSDDHRLNKDQLKHIQKNKHLLKTREELILFAGNLIEEWNTRISKKMSPLQKHNQAKMMDAQPISEEFIARLCWEKAERKIKRCRIIFGNYEYDVENNDNRIKWNGEIVDVYYHSTITDYLFLFSGNEFIEKVYKKRFFEESDGSKFGKIKHNKSLRKYANDLYDQNRQVLAELEENDPLINVLHESDKFHANGIYEEFITQYYLDSAEFEDEENFEFEELPEINL